jgi:hypothetical protein
MAWCGFMMVFSVVGIQLYHGVLLEKILRAIRLPTVYLELCLDLKNRQKSTLLLCGSSFDALMCLFNLLL